jgi:hypothetical protein
MKRSRFSDEQIIGILKEQEGNRCLGPTLRQPPLIMPFAPLK